MYPCVCSVIDHRWRQNVVRPKKWHTRRSRVCHWCSYHILTSPVIYYWIMNIITKPFFISRYFNITQKPAFYPAFARKKAIWRDLIYTKWSNFIGCYALQRIVIGREKSRHCQTWLERRSSLNENLQRKENWTAKSTNLEENAGKIKSVFVIGAALWAENLGRCLENYRNWKTTLVVTVKSGQPRGHFIRVLNERSVNDVGDFCLLWLVILKSAWYIVGDTF